MIKDADDTVGVVAKLKVDPPFEVDGVIELELGEVMVKSEARPVDAPEASETLMVQEIGDCVRCIVASTHDKLDAIVGLP